MSRMIDADALIDCFEMRGDSDLGWHLYEVIDEINDAPTVYKVDRVVMDLENASYCRYTPTFDHPYTDSIIDLNEAIDIVKRGGIDEVD